MVALQPKAEPDPLDARIAELAASQRGRVSRTQLLALGATPASIKWRIKVGRLHPERRGVYAVGHSARTRESDYMAAVLYVGGDASLSHFSAADHQRIREDPRDAIEVTTTGRAAPRPGLGVHRVKVLPGWAVGLHEGIPCTTVARTLMDIAPRLSPRERERALDNAHHVHPRELVTLIPLLEANRRHPGARLLLELLSTHEPGSTLTRSELEERFLTFCATHDIPRPEMNVPVGPFVVDALWRKEGLVAELDGWQTHGTRAAFRRDRERDRYLLERDLRVIRLTWDDLDGRTARQISRLLAR